MTQTHSAHFGGFREHFPPREAHKEVGPVYFKVNLQLSQNLEYRPVKSPIVCAGPDRIFGKLETASRIRFRYLNAKTEIKRTGLSRMIVTCSRCVYTSRFENRMSTGMFTTKTTTGGWVAKQRNRSTNATLRGGTNFVARFPRNRKTLLMHFLRSAPRCEAGRVEELFREGDGPRFEDILSNFGGQEAAIPSSSSVYASLPRQEDKTGCLLPQARQEPSLAGPKTRKHGG